MLAAQPAAAGCTSRCATGPSRAAAFSEEAGERSRAQICFEKIGVWYIIPALYFSAEFRRASRDYFEFCKIPAKLSESLTKLYKYLFPSVKFDEIELKFAKKTLKKPRSLTGIWNNVKIILQRLSLRNPAE